MKLIKVKNYKEMSEKAAEFVVSEINKKPNFVLGCATGKTCLGLYRGLVKSFKKNKIDFSKVKTFNLDEYYPMKKKNKESMYLYMHKNFFDKVNFKKQNINLFNSETKNACKECLGFEKKLNKNKIDLQILGLGVDGHIGYNEPGSNFNSKCRLIDLNSITIKSKFRFKKNFPTKAMTMGIKNILSARKIILLVNGRHKAEAVKHLFKDKANKDWPVTSLKKHKNFFVIADKLALSKV